jgi:hypothetical protein
MMRLSTWLNSSVQQYYTELANDYNYAGRKVVLHYPNPKISIRILLVYECMSYRGTLFVRYNCD